ncbi:electron transfer flavoprotein subunit alpha/FixB family protein [Candidatus Poribacteria bacterium]|nr:electron transfer flavoprotein subunit alpha/FixB family protein [Candidatus Poribacteria bacterium]
MTNKKCVMVFVELVEKKIAEVSLELICEAQRLANKLGVEVSALVIGHGMDETMKKNLQLLGNYGCRKVFYVNDKRLNHFTSVPYAKTIVKTIKEYQPQIVLFGASTTGRDVAPRVASELRCGLTADCTELQIGEYKSGGNLYENTLLQIRPAFGGNVLATIVSPESVPSMATVREGVMKLIDPDPAKTADIVEEKCELSDDDFLTEVIEVLHEKNSVDLKSAKIIVSAGMGASNPDSIELIKKLARVLGGEVGASRPVIDSGLLPKAHQIGQTGTTVRPNLYIACGISGQIQHIAGMSESKRIIAINSDPDAPIFNIAHYGIVGDLSDIIPKMIKAYKAKV